MAPALTPLLLLAALVVCIAGVAKLRSPVGAAGALGALGLPDAPVLVRGFAAAELLLGVWCVVAPTVAAALLLAALYLLLSAVGLLLSLRRASCGCFGADHAPASNGQALLSLSLAVFCVATAMAGPRGLGWVLGRPALTALVLVLGVLGAAYATVLVYTELPRAWSAWSRA